MFKFSLKGFSEALAANIRSRNNITIGRIQCDYCKLQAYPEAYVCHRNHVICNRCYGMHDQKICLICAEHLHDIDNISKQWHESILKYTHYPCVNTGCSLLLTWTELGKHLRTCPWTVHRCPFTRFHVCPWSGFLNELKQHFIDSHHESFLISRNGFHDILLNRNFLISTLGTVFFINTENPQSIFVVKMDTKYPDTVYSYKFNAVDSNTNTGNFYTRNVITPETLVPDVTNRIILPIELTNPDQYKYSIQIMENGIDFTELQHMIFDAIKCFYCKNPVMNPPLYKDLRNETPVCETCYKTLIAQGVHLPNFRCNTNFDHLFPFLKFPCKYARYGCHFFDYSRHMVKHVEKCQFHNFACPHPQCSWVGSIDLIKGHSHLPTVADANKTLILYCLFLHTEFGLFIAMNIVDRINNKLCIFCQVLNEKQRPEKFTMKTIVSETESESNTTSIDVKCVKYGIDIITMMSTGKFAEVPLDEILKQKKVHINVVRDP